MKVLSIDPGIASTGWAFMDTQDGIVYHGQISTPPKLGSKYERAFSTMMHLSHLLDSADAVSLEDYNAYRHGGAAANTLVLCGFVWFHVMTETKANLYVVNNNHWRAFKRASKIKVPSTLKEHESDAVWMLYSLLKDIGEPIPTQRHYKRKRLKP